jgi:predicted site-specific integrase-resolvase
VAITQTPTAANVTSLRYHSVRGTAEILKCSTRTVHRLMKAGRLGYSQEVPGGVIRISDTDIAAYYDASRIGPTVPRQRRTRAAA